MDTDAVPETVGTAVETSAETLAPGSVEHDSTPAQSDTVTRDDVRSIAREVVDSALAEFRNAVPAAPVDDAPPFEQPVRKPWTHRGGK